MNMYDLHAIVNAKRKLSENVLSGCVGCIVFVFEKPSEAYLVEFFDNNNDTIDILTVMPDDIELRTTDRTIG